METLKNTSIQKKWLHPRVHALLHDHPEFGGIVGDHLRMHGCYTPELYKKLCYEIVQQTRLRLESLRIQDTFGDSETLGLIHELLDQGHLIWDAERIARPSKPDTTLRGCILQSIGKSETERSVSDRPKHTPIITVIAPEVREKCAAAI